jgi:hypothetical protein
VRTKRVGEGNVVSVGEQILHGLGVALHERVACLLELFEYMVEIIYRGHSDFTSIVDASSLDTLRTYYAIHPGAWNITAC